MPPNRGVSARGRDGVYGPTLLMSDVSWFFQHSKLRCSSGREIWSYGTRVGFRTLTLAERGIPRNAASTRRLVDAAFEYLNHGFKVRVGDGTPTQAAHAAHAAVPAFSEFTVTVKTEERPIVACKRAKAESLHGRSPRSSRAKAESRSSSETHGSGACVARLRLRRRGSMRSCK